VCSVESVQVLLYSRKHRPYCGVQNVNPLFEFIVNFRHEYCVSPPEDKIIRKWYKQLRETGIVEIDILLSGLVNLMKMWIVLGFHTESEDLPNECRIITDAADDCPQNSSEELVSKTIQISGSQKQLILQLWHTCLRTFWNMIQ
jgi:hypothetical protein